MPCHARIHHITENGRKEHGQVRSPAARVPGYTLFDITRDIYMYLTVQDETKVYQSVALSHESINISEKNHLGGLTHITLSGFQPEQR